MWYVYPNGEKGVTLRIYVCIDQKHVLNIYVNSTDAFLLFPSDVRGVQKHYNYHIIRVYDQGILTLGNNFFARAIACVNI